MAPTDFVVTEADLHYLHGAYLGPREARVAREAKVGKAVLFLKVLSKTSEL